MLKPTVFNAFALQFMVIVGLVVNVSCTNHNENELAPAPPPINKLSACDTFRIVKFSIDVEPIITNNCAIKGCHNGDNGANINWLVFRNFQSHASEVKRRVSLPKTDGDHMPRTGDLSSDQIKLLVCWVEQGALNN